MDQFFIVLGQLFQFFIMLMVGYIAAKSGILTMPFLSGLSKLIMKLLLPLMIFSNTASGATRSQLFESYPILLLALGMYAALIPLTALLSKALRLTGNRAGVYRAAMIFGNLGFIGLPLLTALFPERGAIYIALISIIDQLLLWTYGVSLTTPKAKRAEFSLKSFVNPALCTIAASLILMLLDIPFPALLNAPLLSIGKAATPLSLIYLGGLLCHSNWKPVLKARELYAGIFVKMLLFPILFYFAASLLRHETEVVRAVTLVSSLPTMATIAMLAQTQDNEGEYALGFTLITTLASLLTLMAVTYITF